MPCSRCGGPHSTEDCPLTTHQKVVRELPSFKGYTVDEKLREFRKAEFGKALEFIPFDSPKGRELLREWEHSHSSPPARSSPELPPGIQEWHGVKGFSAVVKDGESTWTVKFKDGRDNEITLTDIMTIAFEEFPGEPIPLIESIHIFRSTSEAFVSFFPKIYGNAVTLVANFKGTARLRKEIVSLFVFMES